MCALPKTFQDAVKITQRIGKRYLWIDSLAIIQDDTQDWESEAAKMAVIYENSFLTIAATSSENCQGGCDIEPWELQIIEGTAKIGSGGISDPRNLLAVTRYRIKLKRANASWDHLMAKLPLYTRGWVLQEAALSRRILHMVPHHMLWQCRVKFDYEDANVRSRAQMSHAGFLWKQSQDTDTHKDVWWELAKTYSTLNLTVPEDRLKALAGIIHFHAVKHDEKPILGLWEKTLAGDLGWRCQEEQASTIPGMPTWTWLSCPGEIKEPIWNFPNTDNQPLVDTWDIDWEGREYVSRLKKSTL